MWGGGLMGGCKVTIKFLQVALGGWQVGLEPGNPAADASLKGRST